jgi:hypothetical protein
LNEQLVVVVMEWVQLVGVELTNTIWDSETLWFIKQRDNLPLTEQWVVLEQPPSSIVHSKMLPTPICVGVVALLVVGF